MNSKFSERLKELRKDQRKTQDELSKVLNVRRSTYGEYERGKIRPPAEKIFKLAEYFNVSIDYLIGNTEQKTSKVVNSTEALEHLELFRLWLMNENQPKTYKGKILSTNEVAVIVTAIDTVKQLCETVVERGNRE